MRLQQATIADYKSVLSFYDDVIARTQDIKRFARWQKGKHPTPEGLRAYIQEGSLYLYKEQDAIIGAVAITMYQGDDYHDPSNTPAHKIYERLGFAYRGKQRLYAENTGWEDFYFFEYQNPQ